MDKHKKINESTILTMDNIDNLRNSLNDKMKVLFGVNDWIGHYEKSSGLKLECFIGKTIREAEQAISYVDRDYEK